MASQPQPATGEELFADYCAVCHGADASGGLTMRPILRELGEVEKLVRGGHDLGNFAARREFMPSWSADDLSDDELGLITTYLESL